MLFVILRVIFVSLCGLFYFAYLILKSVSLSIFDELGQPFEFLQDQWHQLASTRVTGLSMCSLFGLYKTVLQVLPHFLKFGSLPSASTLSLHKFWAI